MQIRDDLHQTVGMALRASKTKLAAQQQELEEVRAENALFKQQQQGYSLATKMASTGALDPDFAAVQEKAAEFSELAPDDLAVHQKAVELYGGAAPQDGFPKVASEGGTPPFGTTTTNEGVCVQLPSRNGLRVR